MFLEKLLKAEEDKNMWQTELLKIQLKQTSDRCCEQEVRAKNAETEVAAVNADLK